MKVSWNWVCTLAAGLALTGCTRFEEIAMPVPQKINAAFPPSPEARLAHERLQLLLAADVDGLQALKSQWEARLALRALECAKNVSVSRLSSVEAVRKLPLDAQCFQAQDRALAQFLGARSVGTLLRMPPLRPLVQAGEIATLPRGALQHINYGTFARDAGVAVLRDSFGDGMVVEMPGAKPIAKLPRGMVHEPGSELSPNGRVYVARYDTQDVVFYEAESGSRLWEMSDASRLLAWLPELSSLIVSKRDGTVMLIDGSTGEASPHPVAAKNSSFRTHLPGPGSRVLIGSARSLSLVAHERAPEGLRATLVKELPISSVYGITSGHPVPMLSGARIVFPSMRDIGWLDLESGASGTWKISPHFNGRFSKLDEKQLMVDSIVGGGVGLKPWVFDLGSETVAPAELGGPRGLLIDIGERVGFMRRGEEAWFGNIVRTGDPVPLERLLADMDLERQLAKLQAETGTPSPGGAGAVALARVPGLEDVPSDAQVHIVGVYEGKAPKPGDAPATARPEPHPARDVRVLVRNTGRPIVLALASYEPVRWTVVSAGARISAVLLSGYHPSTVSGTGNATLLRIGSEYAYRPDSDEYLRLRQAISRYTGTREIRSFQGLYTGSEFNVGGQ